MIINGKDIFQERFVNTLLDHAEWISKADQLMDVARSLERKIKEMWEDWRKYESNKQETLQLDDRFLSTFFMLSSFAIENLLKAIILKNNMLQIRKAVISSKKFPRVLKDHDLLILARKAKLADFAKNNEEYLRKLTRSAVWYGRYPVPISYTDLNVVFTSDVDKTVFTLRSYSNTDIEEVERLVKELRGFASA